MKTGNACFLLLMNVEDDDTKNVRLENDKWTISQRGNLIYQQVEEP